MYVTMGIHCSDLQEVGQLGLSCLINRFRWCILTWRLCGSQYWVKGFSGQLVDTIGFGHIGVDWLNVSAVAAIWVTG